MRLIHENSFLTNQIIHDSNWFSNFIYQSSLNTIVFESTLLQAITFPTQHWIEFFNIFFTNFFIGTVNNNIFFNWHRGLTLLKSFDLFSTWLTLFYIFAPDHITYLSNTTWLNMTTNFNISANMILYFFYFITLVWKVAIESLQFTRAHTANYTHVVNIYLYTWVLNGIDKTESTEETVSLLILWPWCILLIFTHMFTVSNNNFMFGFAEWGLPIVYGLILLLEHLWLFSIYFVIYLTGARGRKSITITLIEDLIALSILLARVLLQAVRGLIVNMFHFICRETLLNMPKWWTMSCYYNSSIGLETESLKSSFNNLALSSDLIIVGSSFIIVTAIMFLQLTFLVISVWLFCKCWFISWHPSIYKIMSIQQKLRKVNVETATFYSTL